MCFHTFLFDLENSLLDGGTSVLVCKHYDVCPTRLCHFCDPSADQNVVILSFVYSGSLENVKRYIVFQRKETLISYSRINHSC